MNVSIHKPELDVVNSIVPKRKDHRYQLCHVQFVFEHNKSKREQGVQIVGSDGARMLVIQKTIKNVLVKDGKNKKFQITPKMLSVLFDEYKAKLKKAEAEIPFEAIKKIASIVKEAGQYPDWTEVHKGAKNKKDENVFSFKNEPCSYREDPIAHFKKECGFNVFYLNELSKFVKRARLEKVDFYQKDAKSAAYAITENDWAKYNIYLMPIAIS